MLKNTSILITGAASGLGRAWADHFCREGATVIGADINEAALGAMEHANLHTVTVDVAERLAVENMVEFAISRTGKLDVLFNNAGVGYGHLVESSPAGAFEHHVAIHLFGCINAMRVAIPHMRTNGYGRIINTISRNAEIDMPKTSGYAAAKAAMWAASRVAAKEVAGSGILINMLIPGPTNSAIWGRDMPRLQSPEATCPTAHMLATLPADGPTGKVFWNEKEYRMFGTENEIQNRQ